MILSATPGGAGFLPPAARGPSTGLLAGPRPSVPLPTGEPPAAPDPQWGKVVLGRWPASPAACWCFARRRRDRQAGAVLAPLLESNVLLCPLHGRHRLAQPAARPILLAFAPGAQAGAGHQCGGNLLTIRGISLVVDTGLERRARFDAAAGLTRLEARQVAQPPPPSGRGGPGGWAPGWPTGCGLRSSRTGSPARPRPDSPV